MSIDSTGRMLRTAIAQYVMAMILKNSWSAKYRNNKSCFTNLNLKGMRFQCKNKNKNKTVLNFILQ